MNAESLLRQGNLEAALAELKAAVAEHPEDAKYRVFLFQVFALSGRWDNALVQLDLAGQLDPATLGLVQVYRDAIDCEDSRRDVFGGRATPLFLGEPQRWLAYLVEALKLDASGAHAEAHQLRMQAFEAAPTTAGRIQVGDHEPSEFQWLADADPRMGPVLEAMFNSQYYWVPFDRIARIDLQPPEDLRDLVWLPAHFVWVTGGETFGLIPTRYAGSESHPDPLIPLARKTDWYSLGQAAGDSLDRPVGQRMLATDSAEHALLDTRQITLEVTASSAERPLAASADH
jgi:type VI secretion system protein ImpE